MRRRACLAAFALTLAGWTAASRAARAAAPPSRPNIVVIMADDMGYSDLGCYGGEIRTPNLDRLASGGLRFTQFYNAARCCPTRASLLTGLYPHQAGVGHMVDTPKPAPGYRGDLNRSSVTLAEVLKSSGYHTLMTGKWHVTPLNDSKANWPVQRGFERYYGTIHGAGSYFAPVSLTDGNTPIRATGDFYYTDEVSEHAESWVKEYAPKTDPFFMYVAYTAPHWPLHARESDVERYRGVYDQGWDALREQRRKRQVELGIVDPKWPLTPRDPLVPEWRSEMNKEWQARRMAVYAAQVDRMDRGIGRIMEALRKSGELDNTLVLFLADNGGCAEEVGPRWAGAHIPDATRDGRPVRKGNDRLISPGPEDTYCSYGLPWANASNTPFRLYKHWVHEGGISTPLIAHWPAGIARGASALAAPPGAQTTTLRGSRQGLLTDEPGHLVDLMSTVVAAAGAQYPAAFEGQPITPMEGKSLLPAFRGNSLGPRVLYWEHEGNRAVRRGNWKLVSKYNPRVSQGWELYDLSADRTEMNNLAAQQPALVRELEALYDAWAARCGVLPWPVQAPAGR
ncbi:MAG: sulfatase [Armatimonadetes bacterium]|nr:sulfatase [Armatimonadota bacterium]